MTTSVSIRAEWEESFAGFETLAEWHNYDRLRPVGDGEGAVLPDIDAGTASLIARLDRSDAGFRR